MNTQQLETFVQVAEHLNFARARRITEHYPIRRFTPDSFPGGRTWHKTSAPDNADSHSHTGRTQLS